MGEIKRLLRINFCGSAADGNRTLIARLLLESQPWRDARLAELERDSKEHGTRAGELDFARHLASTASEDSQGVSSVLVDYCFFATQYRHFIAANPSSGQPSMRSLLAAAASAHVSLLMVDAAEGMLEETRRHAFLVALLGVRHLVLVVDTMDRVEFSQARFVEIERPFRQFAEQTKLPAVSCIPISSGEGHNIGAPSKAIPWYQGPSLIGLLDELEIPGRGSADSPFRLPVGALHRQGPAGTVVAGSVRAGDKVCVQPSGRVSRVARIVCADGDREQSSVGESIALELEDRVEVARGDLIVAADRPGEVADQFEATLAWLGQSALLPGRTYSLKIGAKTLAATVTPLKHRIEPESLQRIAATKLELNEVGVCNLKLDQAIGFDPYAHNRDTGGFVLVDASDTVVAAGMLHFALRRAHNLHWQATDVNQAARSRLKEQKPCVLWYTGLSGAGKSSIANLVDKKLYAMNRHTYLLDGDNVRQGLNKNLGFTDADRVENIRRVAEVVKLMVDAGLIVGAAFISPFRAERRMARALLRPGEFFEIFVDTPLALAEARDPKGLYEKARRGELKNFTGIDSPYEVPENPELRIDTRVTSPELAADQVVLLLEARGCLRN